MTNAEAFIKEYPHLTLDQYKRSTGLTFEQIEKIFLRVHGHPFGESERAVDQDLITSPEFVPWLAKDRITKVIVMSDMQIPYQDEKSLHAVEWYMSDHSWDHYVNIGDFIDVEGISHFSKGKPRLYYNKELQNEYKIANKILDRHQAIVRSKNKNARFHHIFGNHEERVEQWLDENPQLSGIIEVPINLRLKERGFTWTRNGHMGEGIKIGHLNFTHGEAIGATHSKKMAETWGGNVIYGHVHDIQRHSLLTRNKEAPRLAMSIGCLCVYDLPYVNKKPTRWMQGFCVVYFSPDGSFNAYAIDISNHEFVSPDGKRYY